MKKESENFYDILGVAQGATEDEIRTAENALRKLYEQRAFQGEAMAVDLLAKLNEANATLSSPHQRAEYDRRPQSLWGGLADITHAPPIARGERLRSIREFFASEHDVLREATLLDQERPLHLLRRTPLLGDK